MPVKITKPKTDLLTEDDKPILEFFPHRPLIPLPPKRLTKSQIMSLYDYCF